jgi:lysophospholipase
MQVYETAENRAPKGGVCRAITTDDGVQLRVFVAPHDNPRGTVILLNGRADFLERYFETMRDLQARGFACVSFDWRGQGGSQRLKPERLRGFVRSFRHYERDLQAVLKQCVTGHLPGPVLALAHSTGGLVLLHHLSKPSVIQKAVVTAPLLDFVYGSWPKPLAHGLARLCVWIGFGWAYLPGRKRGPLQRHEFDGNPLTSDRVRWDRDMTTLEGHPELGVGGPTFSWLYGALRFMADLQDWPRRKPAACPVLLVAAGDEWVVDPKAARAFAEAVSGVSYLEIAGARHEILMERTAFRKQFWSAFDSFAGR